MGHWVHGHRVRRTRHLGHERPISYWGFQHGYWVHDHHHHTRYINNGTSGFLTWLGIVIVIVGVLILVKLIL
jgi:uncharacterized membrane protein YkgB